MDLSKLSSNWKTLQKSMSDTKTDGKDASVKQNLDEQHNKPVKRKALADRPVSHDQPAKKFKAAIWTASGTNQSKQDKKRKRETGNASSPPSSEQPQIKAGAAVDEDTTEKPVTLGKYVAIDTEMVGTQAATAFSIPNKKPPHDRSILARVSLVSYDLGTLYDAFVLPPPDVEITDYRTQWSGITKNMLRPDNGAKPFADVQRDVARLLKGRILVGHSLGGDLKVLGLSHPRARVRDTAAHVHFREMYGAAMPAPAPATPVAVPTDAADANGNSAAPPKKPMRTPGLKWLAANILGWEIQADARTGHSSVEDAKATMALFRGERVNFEKEARRVHGRAAGVSADAVAGEIEGLAGDKNGEISNGNGHATAEGDDGSTVDDSDLEPYPSNKPKKKKRKKGKKKGRYRRG